MEEMIVLLAIGIGLMFYFIPTIVAVCKKQPNKLGIFFVNLFFGWSLIGWVVALVWAVKNQKTINN